MEEAGAGIQFQPIPEALERGEDLLPDLKHILSLEIHWGKDSSAGAEACPLPEICTEEEGLDIESEA